MHKSDLGTGSRDQIPTCRAAPCVGPRREPPTTSSGSEESVRPARHISSHRAFGRCYMVTIKLRQATDCQERR